ncbi:hypothetical protein BGZ58_000559 [Dissophora ornata]|nr:hypothetical protein BGZ58_000559 [Dissophora ornata]
MEPQAPPRMSGPGSTSKTGAGASTSQGSFSQTHSQNNSADGGGYYIPPASDLTSSDHDKALGVIDAAFKQTDRAIDGRDMKAFGEKRRASSDNSESIFQELNKIRKNQLALAAKHISMETIADDDKSLAPDGKLLDAADKDEIDPAQFERKGQELKDLMARVRLS